MVAEHGIPPQDRIPEKICEQIVDVSVSQVVEQVTGLPENSSQDRNLQGTVEQIPDDPMLEKAEQLVEVPEIVSRDGVQQRIVEQIIDAPVPQSEEELAEVFKVSSQDEIQQRIVEQTIPAFPLAEKIVELLVIQTEGTTQRGVNIHVQHVVNAVDVEKPKIIELTVQRKKFTIQEKINQETKPVESPQAQFSDKAGDMPVVVQRQASTAQTVQKAMEVPLLQFMNKVVDVPVVAQKQISMTLTVQKNIEISQLQVQVSEKTVEISQLQTAEKIVDTFDANGNRVVNELRRRDCVMREMRKNKPPFRLALNRAASDEIAQHCKHCTERGVTKLHGSGTALAEGTRVPVSKMEELIAVHCQASLKTVKDPDRKPYPAYPSGTSWCEACGKMGSGQKFYHDVTPGSDFTAEAQQQHKSSKHQLTKQATRQERGGERKKERNREGKRGRSEQEEGRDQEERKEEERKVEERGSEQVEKDVTGWTVVTRNRRQRKMVQIFVRVNGSKATPMDVNLTDDKVEDVIRRIQNDEDVYVTMHGRVLRRDEKLKSCEVTDGCTIQVTNRLRGGGKHKDKRSKVEKRPAASAKQPEPLQMEKVLEEMVTCIVEGRDVEGEQRLQSFLATIQKSTGWDNGLLENMECRIRQAVEEKRREDIEERDQVAEQEQNKKRRFAEEKQPEETQEQSTDKQDVMSGLEELRTGRGSRPLVRGGDEKCRADETSRKGKGKGNGGKGEHDGKTGGAGSKGRQQVENLVMDEDQGNTGVMRREEDQENHREDVRKLVEMMQKEEVEQEEAADGEQQHSQEKGEGGESEEDGRGRVAPNMGAGGSHPRPLRIPGRKKRRRTRREC